MACVQYESYRLTDRDISGFMRPVGLRDEDLAWARGLTEETLGAGGAGD